jgi:CcmD family protein
VIRITFVILAAAVLGAAAPTAAQSPQAPASTEAPVPAAPTGTDPGVAAPAADGFSGVPAAAATERAAPPRTLRAYWHVFIAFALTWVLLFGYALSLGRRWARLEREVLARQRT